MWSAIQKAMRDAYVFTPFGYSAPSTDVEAVGLLSEGWGTPESRQLEEVEIVDVIEEDVLRERWNRFAYSHHYSCFTSFYDSASAVMPRRSVEGLLAQNLDGEFVDRAKWPQNAGWDDLKRFLQPYLDAERLL